MKSNNLDSHLRKALAVSAFMLAAFREVRQVLGLDQTPEVLPNSVLAPQPP